MLASFYNFTSNTLASIKNFIAPTPAAQKAALKALSVNFDTTALIPNEVKPESYAKWVEAYLKEMPSLSAVLWLKQEKLQLSYNHANVIKHFALPSFALNPATKFVQHEDKNVSLNDVLYALNEPVPALSLLDAQRLPDVKFKVQLALKFISPELLLHVKTTTQRSLNNLESSTNCSICMDVYDHDNPPFLVQETASVYHAPCLEEYRRQKGHGAFCDPKTNMLITHHADQISIEAIGIPDLAYLCAIEDSKALRKEYKTLSSMLDIVTAENTGLKAQIAAHQQAAQNPPPAPVAANSQPKQKRVTKGARRR